MFSRWHAPRLCGDTRYPNMSSASCCDHCNITGIILVISSIIMVSPIIPGDLAGANKHHQVAAEQIC